MKNYERKILKALEKGGLDEVFSLPSMNFPLSKQEKEEKRLQKEQEEFLKGIHFLNTFQNNSETFLKEDLEMEQGLDEEYRFAEDERIARQSERRKEILANILAGVLGSGLIILLYVTLLLIRLTW